MRKFITIMNNFSKFIVPVFVLLMINGLVLSCKKSSLKNCTEHQVAPCQQDASKTNLRIKNESTYDFCNVLISPHGEDTNYGIVEAGQTTCYRPFTRAHAYAFVNLTIEGEELELIPIDYVGETELGPGNFTYTIGVESGPTNKSLSISASED